MIALSDVLGGMVLIFFILPSIVCAFYFHKHLPKKICKNRTKFANIVIEFSLQTICYIIIPLFLLPIFLGVCKHDFCRPIRVTQIMEQVFLNGGNLFDIKNIFIIAGLYVISIPFLLGGVRFSKLREEYPLWRNFSKVSVFKQILYLLFYLVYYINWEFFFRGIMLMFLVQNSHTNTTSYFLILNILQSIVAGIFHYDKPLPEFILSFPTSFIFGYIAYKFNSITPCIIIHYLIGVTFDLFVTYVKVKK